MTVFEALKSRHSVRAFTNKSVDLKLVREVLDYAKYSASGVNLQPWEVAIVTGNLKNKIGQEMQQAFLDGDKGKTDLDFKIFAVNDKFEQRRKACGIAIYKALNITREDRKGQKKQWMANYKSFDAPVVLYFFIDNNLLEGTLIDYGIFMQSIMLGLTSVGLSSCMQVSLAQYPKIVKSNLVKYSNKKLICAMAIGYEDKNHPVNNYRTERAKLSEFVSEFTD